MRLPLTLAVCAALLAAAPAAAQATDVTVSSFDGTPIVAHWFPVAGASAATPAPTVLMGPGWGGAGDVDVNGTGSPGVGIPGIGTLHAAGYNVLTWDPRGFGRSGGTVETDSPAFEGRDTQKLIDWVAGQPGVQLDKPGDPRMGMAGGSYGGGIQLVTAALDKRVDAIAPSISWQSLTTSLAKDLTVKSGWAGLLYAAAAGHSLDPHIKDSYDQGIATGTIDTDGIDWFASRGPGALVKRITAPTLLLQGTVDTLFTLDEAIRNDAILRKAGVPTKMLWFCGGHGACLTPQGDPNRARDATIAWLNRYVKRQTSVKTGPAFDAVDQNGRRFTGSTYPLPAAKPITAAGAGTLRLTKTGGAGPAKIGKSAGGLGSIVAGITPARAKNAVNVTVRSPRAALVVGAPRVTLTYAGKVAGTRPARVFGQLVDDRTGVVVGNQSTPIPLTLDGRKHTVSRPLEVVSERLRKGDRLTLQLTATTVAYAPPRLGGSVRFSAVKLTLPTVTG
jgi:ABC-2 type transport system ATP-binding protein